MKYTKQQVLNVQSGKSPVGGEMILADHLDMNDYNIIRKLLSYLDDDYREKQQAIYGDTYSLENCKSKFDMKIEGGWDEFYNKRS